MKYIISTGIFLTFAILFTASSGVLKAEAYSDYNEYRNYQEDDLYNYDEKDLYGLDKELLEGIDKEALLNTILLINDRILEYILENLDFEELNEELLEDSNGGSAFIIVYLLWIALIGVAFNLAL